MRNPPDTRAYRLLMGSEEFRWRGKRALGMPILCERDGSVCEPVMQFIGWSHWHKRASLSSLQKEAYILREWWAYLDSINCAWHEASDRTMTDWRESMVDQPRQKGKQISDQRIHDKCAVVFTFYDKIPAALHLDKVFVSKTGPITESDIPSFKMEGMRKLRTPKKRWALNEVEGRNTVRRGTPDSHLTLKVLTHLRNSATEDSRFLWRAEEVNDRHWLIGRTMAEAGLRSEEVARLTVTMIENGLKGANIQVKVNPFLKTNPQLTGLDAVVDQQSQDTILKMLDQLEHIQKWDNVWIVIRGKGRVTREAPFPIALVRDLLIFGVWGWRQSQLARWGGASKSYRPPAEIFLSDKTRGAMSKGAIGNLMKDAFAACNSELSGHRLRAYFATRRASKLWSEAFARNGFRWDQVVENLVLEDVARSLGHKHVTTTVRHYLSLAQMEFFGVPTKSKLKQLRNLAMMGKKLPDEQLCRALKLVHRLSEENAGSDFSLALDAILEHPDLVPSPSSKDNSEDSVNQTAEPESRLTIVPKEGATH